MSEETEALLHRLLEGQQRYIKSLESQSIITENVLDDVQEIKKSVARLHLRLDDTAKETTINSESIKHLQSKQCTAEDLCKAERGNIWKEIRKSKAEAIAEAKKEVMNKIYLSVISGFGALILTLISIFWKKITG